jgi:general stress protein YciG
MSTESPHTTKERRGFASMDADLRRAICSKGGKRAHQLGVAHQYTSEEAREAGRKGGAASHRRRRERLIAQGVDPGPRPNRYPHPSKPGVFVTRQRIGQLKRKAAEA